MLTSTRTSSLYMARKQSRKVIYCGGFTVSLGLADAFGLGNSLDSTFAGEFAAEGGSEPASKNEAWREAVSG
jgi:hypothetical protein